MEALRGSYSDRARAVLAAGCDLVLHCSGEMSEMREVAAGCESLTAAAADRLGYALSRIAAPVPPVRSEEHTSELQSLMRTSYAVFSVKQKKRHYSQTKLNTRS